MFTESIVPGSRYASDDPALLNLQAPTGIPRSSRLASVTDPISMVPAIDDQLAHFWPGLYDLSPESHLSRFLKVILGDAGSGSGSKQFTAARLQTMVATSRYLDLDRLYGSLMGVRRMASEDLLGINPYFDDATPEEWNVIEARDAAYRARVEAFSRSIALGATPAGMAAIASAIVGIECRIHETYLDIDEGSTAGSVPAPVGGRTYAEVESGFIYYGNMRGSYANIEGGASPFGGGGDLDHNRAVFIVTPKRLLTLEETYELTRVLSRFKPAGTLLRIEPNGVPIHRKVNVRHAYADSTYWEVNAKVAPTKKTEPLYDRTAGPGVMMAQPRPAMSGYQGEAWSYNADVASVVSYTVDETDTVTGGYNYQRLTVNGVEQDFTPNLAVMPQEAILRGRAVSPGVLSSSPYRTYRGGNVFNETTGTRGVGR